MHRALRLGLSATLVVGCGQGAPSIPAVVAPSSSPAAPLVATASPAAPSPAAPSPAAPSAATPQGARPAGSIVFMRPGPDGRFQTWTACVDLSRSVQVPTSPGRDAGWAVWAPDGSRIAFNANFDDPDLDGDPEIWDIYTMDADGANVLRLTQSAGLYGDPGYSRDGRLIAFGSTVSGSEGVYMMQAADGTRMRRVTGLPDGVETAYAPRFSPDGTELVFTGVIDDRSGALFVVGVDGSNLRRITPSTLSPDKAAWSPSSGEIVFDAASAAYPFQSLWTVRADGSALTNITAGFGIAREGEATDGFSGPAWSPDGSLILVVHGLHSGDGTSSLRFATIRPDGSELRDLSDSGAGFKPDWTDAAC